MLLLLSSNATSSVSWTVSLFNDVSLHLLTDSNKSPHYISPRLCHSPVYNTKGKFCSSCIKQHWTVHHNFLYKCGIVCPPNVLQTSLHFKQRKISQFMHCVPSNAASCWCGLSATFRYPIAMFKTSTVVATATALQHAHTPQVLNMPPNTDSTQQALLNHCM
jgi:hypothetical protein